MYNFSAKNPRSELCSRLHRTTKPYTELQNATIAGGPGQGFPSAFYVLLTLYSPLEGSNTVSKKTGSGAGSIRSKPSMLKWRPCTSSDAGSMVTFTAIIRGSKNVIAFLMDFARYSWSLGDRTDRLEVSLMP